MAADWVIRAETRRFARAAAAIVMLASVPAIAAEDSTEGEAEEASGASPALSEPAAQHTAQSRHVFPPSYFVQFNPRNAFDMLERLPGFTLQEAEEQRGLGQATSNLLLNGARLTAKSETAEDILKRINASDVVRIELVDGATLDMPGLSGQVANIVARASGFSGQFAWLIQAGNKARKWNFTNADISATASIGRADINIAFANDSRRGGSIGPGLIYAADGELLDDRLLTSTAYQEQPKLSAGAQYSFPGGTVASLGGSYLWNTFRWRRREERNPIIGDPAVRFLQRNDYYDEYEISGDLEFALGPGRLKLIGLEAFKGQDYSSQAVLELDEGDPDSGTRYELRADSGERIARAEYSWPMLGGDWQLSSEAAFNRLENISGLFEIGGNGEFVAIPFPAGTGGVTEDRFESILSYGRPITERLSLQLALGGEYSKLIQTGANAEERSFRRPKGSVSLAWAANSSMDIAMRLNRRVGQLEFGDFLAQVFADDDNQNAGNNQLVPEQSWEAELEISRDFGAWGSARLKLQRIWIEDVVTYILSQGGESLGNVASADRKRLTLDSTVNFTPLGLAGARIDILLELEDSSIADPLTGIARPIGSTSGFNLESEFRHDIPGSDWAWGFEANYDDIGSYYRIFEVGEDDGFRKWGEIYAEHKDVYGLTIRGSVKNLFGETSRTDRTFYDGPRDRSPVLYSEVSDRKLHRFLELEVRGNF